MSNVGYYLGKVILGLAFTMLIPIAVAALFWEGNPLLDFAISAAISFIFGMLLIRLCDRTPSLRKKKKFSQDKTQPVRKDLTWMQGMIVASLSWIVAMLLGAIPFYLSGHWHSYLDACFDAMSGFATTGLVLVQNLDHLSYTHNFWRHFIMFIGGQGILIIALSFLVKGSSGAFKMYVGEARDEKILPNVIHTSRFIWLVSIVYLVLGTLVLALVGILDGLKPLQSLFHGICIFMAAFDTGGFTPQSQNILYYHSFVYELVTIVIMVLGAINFKLHYHLWTGNRKEIIRNIETVTLFFAVMATFTVVGVGLAQSQTYPQVMTLFRKGFYQLISGHTGTGYQTVYAGQFMHEWAPLSLVGLIIAMALGGAVCSTTGAIKMLRIGVIFKAFIEDIKRIMLPERALVVQKYHHIKTLILEDKLTKSALIITLAYCILYVAGSLVGMFFGYPFLQSLFESVSAAANVGLSCGVTAPAMPAVLKITYIVQMWAGRLEFMSVFTLIGVIIAVMKGK